MRRGTGWDGEEVAHISHTQSERNEVWDRWDGDKAAPLSYT